MSLPKEYTRLTGIEATGTQYIDTGVNVSSSTHSKIRLIVDELIKSTSGWSVSGCGTTGCIFFVGTSNGVIYYGNGGNYSTGISYPYKRCLFDLDAKNGTYTVDVVASQERIVDVSSISVGSFSKTYPINLFRYSGDNGYHSGIIYGAQVYEDGILIRDFVPAKRLSDGEIGLYDIVGDTFYANAGTGSFIDGTPIWRISDGYPYIEGLDIPSAFSYTEPYPTWVWRISPNYVKYPYLAPLTVISKPLAVKQSEYITVHDMMTKQDEFANNGLRILFPTSCDETEELNGGYELVLEHPIDKDGAWEQLKELNVLKVNGQLFPIYRVVSNFSGNKGKITAYARHIFYFLLDRWIFSASINALSGQDALAQIMGASESFSRDGLIDDGLIDYQFTASSDLKGDFSAVLSEQTPISAIMGSDKSLIEVLGGELYRDNFYFSVNKRKENSKENAFDIRVGLNLQGIKREIDYSDFCTYLRVFDGFGSWWAVSYVPSGRFSHNVVRSVTLKYDSPPGMERLAKDGQAYFDTIKEPRITYTVSLADVRSNPDYQEFGNLPEYNVGDSGRIYDERLGIYTEQRIIRRKVDRLTGLVKEVTFGNTERSLTRKPKFANTIATADDKYLLNQMTQAEAKNLGTWADAAKYTWGELARFTWGQVGGNNGN